MTPKIRYALLIITLSLTAQLASAQVPTGTPPFGTYADNGAPDIVNLANLNAHIAIPVLHKAGRGLDFVYDLSYDSSVWYPVGSWQPVYNWGWRATTEAATGYISYSTTFQVQYHCYTQYYTNWAYHDAWGVVHAIPGEAYRYWGSSQGYGCSNYFIGFGGSANDGSGYSLSVATNANQPQMGAVTAYTRDGKIIGAPVSLGVGAGTTTDSNGNYISADSGGHIYDTLSSTTPVLTIASPAPPASTTFTYNAPSGAAAPYTMKYVAYTVQTNFGCSGITEFGPTVEDLVSEIDLPDSSKYTFTYEGTPGHSGNVTGRLASVTLPTGGTITYAYTGGSSGHITCADGSASGLQRKIYDGTNTNTWTYSRGGTVPATTTTILDPQGNQTISNFSGIYETQSQVYQGTSTLLETLLICYNNNFTNCAAATVAAPITKRDVYTTLPNLANPAVSETTYNSFGQLTEDKEIDFVQNTNGSPYLSDTTITYSSINPSYSAQQQTTVKNNAGTAVSQATISFDQTGVTATSGTPQHTTPTGARGNPTTISHWVQGSTTVHKTFTYYDTGNVMSATDVNGAQTSFTYGACGNSFPTSVSEPLSLSKTMTWNCTGAVETSVTDENSKLVSKSYTDADFWRPNSFTDQQSYVTYLSYGGQTSAESSMNYNNNGSTSDTLATLDGLGRSHISQTKQSPSSTSYDSVETDYDVVSRPYRVTLPYSGTAGQTNSSAPSITTTYDALNRPIQVTDAGTPTPGTRSYTYSQNDVYQTVGPAPSGENAKRRQLEYDALGRVTSVCEITNASGSGICGQNVPQTGFWTKYTYDPKGNLTGVTQNAQAASGQQQTRSYTYDGLSRMTSETNPESGTTTYTYDSATGTGCAPNSPGNLIKQVDAIGNWTCFNYDALNRVTDVGNSIQNAANPCKRFRYDNTPGLLGSLPSGVSVSNVLGRVTEAATDTCAFPITQSTIITDEWFGYTARGETSDVYESTPHSGGYYHVAGTYWANGVLNQLTDSPSGYYIVYGVDGEGRVYSTTTGGNPLLSTLYNSASQPTQVNLGYSGDSDSYTYDPNTGRMTQYKFNINGQAVVGNLTWNANGTLGSLGLTDPFNSSNSQSCAYSHDDMTRITSANCGSIWSQTFSYDPFGNINKAGNSSFGATYSPTTNQMTTIGTSTPTYDADGDVTNDFLHSYSWDTYGRPITVIDNLGNSVSLTYDATGRMVEQNRSGALTQLVYSPTGFLMQTMNGQASQFAFTPNPGGGATVWSPTGIYYRHADWLGSSRFASTTSRTMYYDGAYAPFGEQYANSGTTDLYFTGMNSDTSSNLYDFPAREYGIQGRWPSPDPAGIVAVDLGNPQSWNRYAYVLNDPLTLVDPTGLDCQSTIEGGVVCTPNPISLCPPGGTATGACSGYPFCPTSGCKSDAEQCVAKALKNGGNAAACAGGHGLLTIGPNNNYEGSKKQLCDTTSDKAFWVDILPFGSTLLGGDYSPGTVSAAGAAFAAGKAIDYTAGSPRTLRSIRSLTGALTDFSVPMTVTARLLTYYSYAQAVYSGYHALNAAKDAYQACIAN